MTTFQTLQFRQHPKSGEIFAVEVDAHTLAILRAVGPCRQTEAGLCDPDGVRLDREDLIRDWLDNVGVAAVDDAAWLVREIG
jgi:hypothetical protein